MSEKPTTVGPSAATLTNGDPIAALRCQLDTICGWLSQIDHRLGALEGWLRGRPARSAYDSGGERVGRGWREPEGSTLVRSPPAPHEEARKLLEKLRIQIGLSSVDAEMPISTPSKDAVSEDSPEGSMSDRCDALDEVKTPL